MPTPPTPNPPHQLGDHDADAPRPSPHLPSLPSSPTHQSGGHDADGPGQEGEVVPGVESVPEGAQGERHHGRLEGDDPPPSLPPHPPPPTHQSGGHDADGPGQEGEVVPGVESMPEGAQGERHHGRLEGDDPPPSLPPHPLPPLTSLAAMMPTAPDRKVK